MTVSRFRSVRELSSGVSGRRAHRLARPAIERSTFVIVTLGGTPIAIAVECVERVVRPFSSLPVILYESRQLPFADLAGPLGRTLHSAAGEHRRVLVIQDGGRRWAVPVDGVQEVYAVETALVRPMAVDAPHATTDGVQGWFHRQDEVVLVIDAVRLLLRTAAARARS